MLKTLLRTTIQRKPPPQQHNLKTPRFFRTSAVNPTKLFQDSENLHVYSVLRTIPVPENAIFVPKTPDRLVTTQEDFNRFLARNWRSATATEIAQAFRDVVDFCALNTIPVSDSRFDNLVDGLMDHVEKLTDEELADLLKCFIKFPRCETYASHNFHDVWSALDDICVMRMNDWSTEKRFYFAELWYRLNLGRLCDYTFECLDKVLKRASYSKLTKEHLLRTFFHLNIARKRKVEFELEFALESVINELSADEMAVVALGFFKTESKIKSLIIISAMCRKIIEEHDSIHDISLAAILKALRLASPIKSAEMFYNVLESLIPEVERLSNLTCIHIALLGTSVQVLHKQTLGRVVERISRDLENPERVRLKEIERLLLATTMFDFESEHVPDFYERCCKELKKESRRLERASYVRCTPCALNYLAIRKIYDFEFMNQFFDQDFIKDVYGKQYLPRELMVLDYSIEIECPDYRGNRFAAKNRAAVVRLTSEYIPSPEYRKQSLANKLFLNVQKAVTTLIKNPDLCMPLHVLPHFSKADIILCKDLQTNEFVPVKNCFEKYATFDIKYPRREENLKWFAIIILALNNTVHGEATPLGLMNMKARQLKAIGYEPIFVSWCEVFPTNEEGHVEILRKKLC